MADIDITGQEISEDMNIDPTIVKKFNSNRQEMEMKKIALEAQRNENEKIKNQISLIGLGVTTISAVASIGSLFVEVWKTKMKIKMVEDLTYFSKNEIFPDQAVKQVRSIDRTFD